MDGAFDLNLSLGTRSCPDEIKAFENKIWKEMASWQSLLSLHGNWARSDSET